MRIVISGASGLIGNALVPYLERAGHSVGRLERGSKSVSAGLSWDPRRGNLDPCALEGSDAVICLSGANVGEGRWSASRKSELLSSRVDSVSLLARTVAGMDSPPGLFISASAVGIYGAHNGAAILDEDSPSGDDFLAQLCVEWEAAAEPMRAKGIRVIHIRFGVVLDRSGGMLGKIVPIFRCGLGGRLGNGNQYLSWIAMSDVLKLIEWCLVKTGIQGAINGVSSKPITNREFTKALGRILRRPTILPVPAIAIRILLGEMGRDLLLGSTRVRSKRLEQEGFVFQNSDLDTALAAMFTQLPNAGDATRDA